MQEKIRSIVNSIPSGELSSKAFWDQMQLTP